MPRYFTVPQAEKLLPSVERALRDALFHRAEAVAAQNEIEETSERVRLMGGVRLNPVRVAASKTRLESSIGSLKAAIDEVEETGALIKDLDIGLIDFLSRFEDRDVCLCWKLGETGIHFWHGMDEGFRGRKPVNQEFLAGHSAGSQAGLN